MATIDDSVAVHGGGGISKYQPGARRAEAKRIASEISRETKGHPPEWVFLSLPMTGQNKDAVVQIRNGSNGKPASFNVPVCQLTNYNQESCFSRIAVFDALRTCKSDDYPHRSATFKVKLQQLYVKRADELMKKTSESAEPLPLRYMESIRQAEKIRGRDSEMLKDMPNMLDVQEKFSNMLFQECYRMVRAFWDSLPTKIGEKKQSLAPDLANQKRILITRHKGDEEAAFQEWIEPSEDTTRPSYWIQLFYDGEDYPKGSSTKPRPSSLNSQFRVRMHAWGMFNEIQKELRTGDDTNLHEIFPVFPSVIDYRETLPDEVPPEKYPRLYFEDHCEIDPKKRIPPEGYPIKRGDFISLSIKPEFHHLVQKEWRIVFNVVTSRGIVKLKDAPPYSFEKPVYPVFPPLQQRKRKPEEEIQCEKDISTTPAATTTTSLHHLTTIAEKVMENEEEYSPSYTLEDDYSHLLPPSKSLSPRTYKQ